MSPKNTERALSAGLATAAVVIIWLLLRHRGTVIQAGGGDGLQPVSVPPLYLNGSKVNPVTLNFTPGNYSFLSPPSSPRAVDSCACECESGDSALAGIMQDAIQKAADGISAAEASYIASAYGQLPDWLTQYINNGDAGQQLYYQAQQPPPTPSNPAPAVDKHKLVFQKWDSGTKSKQRDMGRAGQGWWIDPANGQIVGYGTPASLATADGEDDITFLDPSYEDATGIDYSSFQLVNGLHSNPLSLMNPISWGH